MSKYDFFSDLVASILDDPIGFLKSFIMLAVPSGALMWVLIVGTYAENTGHGFIGWLFLSFYGFIDKITLFIVETFIELVVYVVVMVTIVTSLLAAFGIKIK
ncbi:hypothetical protein MettiDRAFT_2894 [Methanolobus tindarius DSM 2278]|uniref:Uncharacterized protein n=1 Tax=Methanolobus tindarius DSM 2278 TaxID=1090322 RepID=W9DUS6_METTI|nr:hypothetical protein [Methanolobus tindarius]ETA69395.1 hypothetical protein MettiDRAFT_2894 [Methanolobus tindarius DSM 2278]